MKRSLLVISLFLLTTLPSKAQVGDSRNLFSIGFNGGLGTSSVSFIPTIKQDISLGPTAGLTIRHISEKYFFLICGLQLECNYATRGWTELIDDGSGNVNIGGSRDI
jgi:hypothetical protein